MKNYDNKTIQSFGNEWEKFDQSMIDEKELQKIFNDYFKIFPWDKITKNSTGFDMGCGSGRWAKIFATKVKKLYCIDPSSSIEVARSNLKKMDNVELLNESIDDNSIKENSQDFGYSLGVLHHIPDTQEGINSCVKLLKQGAPFLLYIYYAFDNRSYTYKAIWKASNLLRKVISSFPNNMKNLITDLIALTIYYPISRISHIFEKININTKNFPLYYYRNHSIYTLRTDSRDRFGTPLEKRYTKIEIEDMMIKAGLIDIKFSVDAPFWCAVGTKK